MAITGSFKQQCPSCEANVLIKDPKFIGKKVDCPKCKYRFVVEDPALKDKKKVAAGDTVSGRHKDTAVTSKVKANAIDDDEMDIEEEEEVEAKARPGGKGASGKRPRDDDDDFEDDEPKAKKGKKKKKGAAGNNKMLIGLALGGVGLIVLAVAGLFLAGVFGGDSPKTAGKGGTAPQGGQKGQPDAEPKGKGGGDPKGKDQGTEGPVVAAGGPAGPDNTNFLPRNTESVYHCNFKDFQDSPLGKTAFSTPGAFSEADFQQKLGIALPTVDDILTAESYSENWTFHVIHVTTVIKDMRPLIQAMGLKEWDGNKTKHKCYEVHPSSAAWVLSLAKLPLFVPAHTLTAQGAAGKDRPLLLHMRNAQTMIFAHAEPMLAYLKAGGNIEPNKANVASGKKFDPNADPFQPEPFLTISPPLRDMLIRVETRKDGKVLVSSATHLRSALRTKSDSGSLIFRVRPFWDVVNILQEKTNRIQYVGMAFLMKDQSHYTFNNSLVCNSAGESTQLHGELLDNVAWQVKSFFERGMSHKVEVIYDDPLAPPDPDPATKPAQPPLDPKYKPPTQPKKEDITSSHIKAAMSEKTVDFRLNLMLTGQDAVAGMRAAVQLMAIGLKAEAESAAGRDYRFQLAEAGKILGEKGLSKRGVPPETFPPGAFERKGSEMWNAREPGQRVSWMAGLLPFLGQDTLYSRIQFDLSWRDGPNWLPARTIVPQFLDPSYPANSRYVSYPGLPLDCAATHFVGLSGIGMDAADAVAGDPTMIGKLGIFGYNRTTPLSTIKDKGRGLANTVLLIRVPHDGPAGVTPWMAGGGSTVRSVPDKNSLAPFVSPGPKGEEGTVVLMADGSVRFLKKGMSDAAFKAIVTVDGPTPDGLNLEADSTKLEPAKEEPKPLLKDPVPVGPGTGKPATTTPKGETQTLPQGWQVFTHKDGGFSVAMPTGATPNTEPVPGNELVGYKYVNPPAGTTYMAAFLKMSPNELQAAKASVDQGLNEFKKGLETGSGIPVVSETKVSTGKYAGREFVQEVQGPGGKATVMTRVFLVEERAYILILGSPTINRSSPEYTAFFESFKLIGAK